MASLTSPVVSSDAIGGGDQPALTATGLRLLPWTDQHVAPLVQAYADPEIRYWNGESMDPVEAAAYAQEWAQQWRQGRRAGWAVQRGQLLVGRVALNRIDTDSGRAEVTYWATPGARGTGVIPGAVTAVVGWAFGLGFHRLELLHSVRNTASCRVAAKTGFLLEGTLRQHGLHQDGWHDMHLHARLASDHPYGSG